MSLKSKFFTFLTVAVGIVGLTTFTLAQEVQTTPSTYKVEKRKGEGRGGKRKFHGEGRGEGRGKRHAGKMHGFRGIELTDAQKAQISVIRANNKPERCDDCRG